MTYRHQPRPAMVHPRLLEQREFEGLVRHVTYESEEGDFKIVLFRTTDGHEFKAAGNFLGAEKGQPMRLRGEWREHPRHGWTFQAQSWLPLEPATEDSILAYLGSGLIKGVRRRTAEKIIAHFGTATLDILDHAPERLLEVPRLSRQLAASITTQWAAHRQQREAMMALKTLGLSNALALRLLQHYGENAVAVLRTNPYRVGLEVKYIGFATADEIAAKAGIARDSPARIAASFVHLLDQASSEGHTFLPRVDLLSRASELLDLPLESIEAVLADAVAQNLLRVSPVGETAECYFLPSLHRCESQLAARLLELARQARVLVRGDVDAHLAAFEERYGFRLARQQHEAIRTIAGGGVCVITGGPGTGKTTLVRALLHVVRTTALRYALASPTGRAAQRLAETTHEPAATIHRLLKWNATSGRFIHGPDNRLEIDLLIVDEASMLDVVLANSLLGALPAGASVVFVGDVDQLPSVGPGNFLRDLIESERARVTRLDVIFRQGRESLIITNSHRINKGQGITQPEPGDTSADFYFVKREEPAEIISAMLASAIDRIPGRLHVDPIDGVQVLSPMRRGPLGTIELNALLQARLNPNGAPIGPDTPLRVGDKVIQTCNNYDLDVYNGDVGRLCELDPETRTARIEFGRREVFYPYDSLGDLELAYAITIHKSQGSEYPAVVVVLHGSHFVMLRRNLVYTAVTRGKRFVVIIGNQRALYKAINTSTENERRTALGWWLTHPPERTDLFGPEP